MQQSDAPHSEAPHAEANPSAGAAAAKSVAIVDPSRLRRECLRLAISQNNPDWHVGEAASADELSRLIDGGGHFDLVLIGAATSQHIDLRQVESLRRALPDIPLIVVAETDDPQRARQILSTGARGFLPASMSVRVLIGAIDLVLAGGVYVPSSLIESQPARPSAGRHGSDQAAPWSMLTRRQRDVLQLISQGQSNKLIAAALSMSESTVKAHVKQVIKRLNVVNRTQAALVATGRPHLIVRGRNGSAPIAEAASPE